MEKDVKKRIKELEQHNQTLRNIDLETGIREGIFDIKSKPIENTSFWCSICVNKIEDFVVLLSKETENAKSTSYAHIDCYYIAKKGYFRVYIPEGKKRHFLGYLSVN